MCESIETWIQVTALIVAIIVGVCGIYIARKTMRSSILSDFLSLYKSLQISNNLNLLSNNLVEELPEFIKFYKKQVLEHGGVQKPIPAKFVRLFDITEAVFYEFVLTYQIMETMNIEIDKVTPILFRDITMYRIVTEDILDTMKQDKVFKDGISKYILFLESAKTLAEHNGLRY